MEAILWLPNDDDDDDGVVDEQKGGYSLGWWRFVDPHHEKGEKIKITKFANVKKSLVMP